MESHKLRLAASLLGCALMGYLLASLPAAFYEPSRMPDMNAPVWLVHLILLYIHEAGHAIFRPFGETMYVLGGSIMQVLAPAAWIAVALRDRSPLAAPAVFFTGCSMVDISVYMKDAATRLLPLIGGKRTGHDWWTVLSRRDALDLGVPLGETFFWLGMVVALGGLAWSVYLSVRMYMDAAAA